MKHDQDLIERKPDIAGTVVHARAWRVDIAAAIKSVVIEQPHAMLDMWLVEAPWAHPMWHSYAVVLVHLRPLANNRPTKFYLTGATHEMWVQALDPRHPRGPALADQGQFHGLTPLNFAAQFIETNDETARGRIRHTVEDICAGRLSPDTDFLRHWVARFGDNMIRKAPRRAEDGSLLQ